MEKYIDADKLIAEIQRQIKLDTEYGSNVYDVCTELLSFIASLQREHPKFKAGDTIRKIGENTAPTMTIERIYDGDYVCVTEHQQSFINIKFQDDYELVDQERPEDELEKEITTYIERHFHIRYDETLEVGNDPLTTHDFEEIARHFAEWGAIHFNAKKGGTI